MSEFPTEAPAPSAVSSTWLGRWSNTIGRYQIPILVAGVGLQIAILAVMIATPLRTILSGQSVLLRVVPVDPRDLFRGDYVILSYEFSRVPNEIAVEMASGKLAADTIFVTLEPEQDGRHYRATHFGLSRPAEGIYLRGRIKNRFSIEYGIESFFVQEGLSAEVVVDSKGNAMLKGLVVDQAL
jgi:uncharacterized membrane-anchored protein